MTVGETPENSNGETLAPETGAIRYFQRPKPYAAELELTLTASQFIAERGKSRHEMPYYGIERIRLRFTPKNSVFRAFTCDVRAKDGRSVRFDNVSWKSLIETERMDDTYNRFISALIARASKANPEIELHAGMTTFRHTGMVVIGAGMLVALAGCVVYAAMQGNTVVALMALGLTGYLAFWMKEFATRNRPRTFTPDTIPTDVLPR
jgi:hypothetical protein